MSRPHFKLLAMGLTLAAGAAHAGEPEGAFVGVLPCADCPAIDYRLDLFADRVYYQRLSYRERAGSGFDQIGHWSLSEDGRTLILSERRDGPTRFAMEDADKLTMLDRDGNRIESGLNYSLFRSERLAPLVPQLSLRGMFSYFADAALFEECNTGRRMPVAMEGDYLRLERAWLAGGHSVELPVMASVQGRIVERVNMEGPARPTVIVERFEGLSPGEQCAPSEQSAVRPKAGSGG